MQDNALSPFGIQVEQARVRCGLSKAGLAEKVGVSRNTLWRHATGQTQPSVAEVRQYAEVLGVSVSELTGEPADTDWATALREDGPGYAITQLEDFVSNLDKVVRLLSTGDGARMGPKSKLAIMNGIEEAARLAGQKLPAEFYDLRRRINEGTL